MSASRKPGSDILHVAATLCRYGLDPMSGRVSAREYERLHELQVGFGVLLRRDLDALRAEVASITAERDRLARVLAVERGDATAAPKGWRVSDNGWTKHIAGDRYWDLDHRNWPRRWRWCLRENDDGYIGNGQCYHTALEAMEAAAGEPTP